MYRNLVIFIHVSQILAIENLKKHMILALLIFYIASQKKNLPGSVALS
jgi:hypothetical protein